MTSSSLMIPGSVPCQNVQNVHAGQYKVAHMRSAVCELSANRVRLMIQDRQQVIARRCNLHELPMAWQDDG